MADSTNQNVGKQKNSTVFVTPTLVDLPKQRADSTTDDQYAPSQVFAGERHTIVSTKEKVLLAAGWNKYKQLGLDDARENGDKFEVISDIELNGSGRIICGDWCTIYVPNL